MGKWKLCNFIKTAGLLGGGSVTLAILLFGVSIFEHVRDKNVTAYSLVLIAAVFFCFGSYCAWSAERGRYEQEAAKNATPELQLELLAAFYDRTRVPGATVSQINVYAYMRITNLREPETLINNSSLSLTVEGREYTTGGNGGDRTVGFIQHNTDFRLGGDVDKQVEIYTPVMPLITRIHAGMPLRRGIPVEGLVTFTFLGVQDRPSPDQTILEATNVRFSLVDSFGKPHDLKIARRDMSFGTLARPD